MSQNVEFCKNRATEEEMAAHLVLCDSRFVPPLSSRVTISEYAHKIYTRAMRFEAWTGGALVGLVGIYTDNHPERFAYITTVSVLATTPEPRIASQLLDKSAEYLKDSGFRQVELEVDRENQRAIRLYERHGFIALKVSGRTVLMRRYLSN
jgi:ribosomal protein S18 acetylase RimI-like enzyme